MSYSVRQRVLKWFENDSVEDVNILRVWTTDDAIHVLGTYKDLGGFEDKRFAITLERQTGPLDEYVWPEQHEFRVD